MSRTETQPGTYRIDVPGWLPTSLNKLVGNRWAAARRKKADARTIDSACSLCGVPPVGLTTKEKRWRRKLGITGGMHGDPQPRPRHVSLEIKLGKGERAADPDNLWKSLLDGLKHAGMIFEDNRQWCSHDAEITWTRGTTKEDRGTTIVIEDR